MVKINSSILQFTLFYYEVHLIIYSYKANDGKQDSEEIAVTVKVYPIADTPRLLTRRSTGDQDTFVPLQVKLYLLVLIYFS